MVLTLNPIGVYGREDHQAITKRFKKYHANHCPDAGYQLVADFTASGRLHWHGFSVGSTPDQVLAAWEQATGSPAWQPDVRPILTTVEQATAYAFKVRGDNRGRALLLPARGFHVTPTHNFFNMSKAILWKDFKARHFGTRRGDQGVDSPSTTSGRIGDE